MQISITLLCLFESIINRNNEMIDETYTSYWFERPLLILSFLITLFVILSVFSLYWLHVFRWKVGYTEVDKKKFNTNEKFDNRLWSNKACDALFENRADVNVNVLQYDWRYDY